MKAIVDQDLCIGCALCTTVCPDVFTMDDTGMKAVAKQEELSGSKVDCARAAADQCPVTAINIA